MVEKNLVGRCGLYCGACTIYRAYKDGGAYLQGRARYFNCPPERVRCEGCMALTPDSWGHACKIVQCMRNNGFDFCYQCREYVENSCGKFGKLAKDYLEDGVDLRANLERIKKGQTEAWLRESAAKFKCPECGKPLSVGAIVTNCHHCGKDLSHKKP